MTKPTSVEEIFNKIWDEYYGGWETYAIGRRELISAIKALIKRKLPKEDLRQGVMPYEQGLIDGRNQVIADINKIVDKL